MGQTGVKGAFLVLFLSVAVVQSLWLPACLPLLVCLCMPLPLSPLLDDHFRISNIVYIVDSYH